MSQPDSPQPVPPASTARSSPDIEARGAGWIDGHLDLAYLAVAGRDFTVRVADVSAGCVSYPDLADAPVRVALGTIFTEANAPGQPGGYRDSRDVEGAHRVGLEQLRWYQGEEAAGRMRILRTRADLDAHWADVSQSGPLGIVVLMEGADPMRTPEEAAWWFAEGVRVVGMSWAYGSRYSGGNSTGGPLTGPGRELVAAFDALGILHDASHLSDASLDDLLARSTQRVVATHSNCRMLLEPKERHLTDGAIKEIAARGGVIGLNLFGNFLAVGRDATLDDALDHTTRVASLAGAERCCLGSDLDGGFVPTKLPLGLRHPRSYASLARGLAARGWSPQAVDGFRAGNWLRTLRASLPSG